MEASEELIDILLKNGFQDTSQKVYPVHFDWRESGKVVVPNVKVKLSYSEKSSFDKSLTFDYDRILVSTNKPPMTEQFYVLDRQLLRNILTWFSMPEGFRREYKHYKIMELHMKIQEIRTGPRPIKAKQMRLISAYDSIHPYWVE